MFKNIINKIKCFLGFHQWSKKKQWMIGHKVGYIERCNMCGKFHKE